MGQLELQGFRALLMGDEMNDWDELIGELSCPLNGGS